ncbi:unnamed protein product [Paramecium octaurelia]|uniref:Adenylosuccinate lyase n=1 Tax=Paramecium octaurelia TaxID=43137 RepID=A0A8S1V2U0_PAROT|nr:unnamed protein product [Paramecium octaurelia]
MLIFRKLYKFSSQFKESTLTAISPLDGRYASQTGVIKDYFSEYALMKYRIKVEIEWLKFLHSKNMIKQGNSVLNLTALDLTYLDLIYDKFDVTKSFRVKQIESTTNHDVKSIEYYIKEELDKNPILHSMKEYVHFCCTSEDINNIAYSLMMTDAKNNLLMKSLEGVINKLVQLSHDHHNVPMLSRTHGQVASPTTVGKEFANFAYRIRNHSELLRNLKFEAKLNGAVGNYNAHLLAYPNYDWPILSKQFIEELKLKHNPFTTQIEPHDSVALYYSYLNIINNILVGLSRDVWSYISINYFEQKSIKSEVGSSTMPHKVNPIDFENCEGNLGLSNSLAQHFMNKLVISRYQRDLSDSTVMRNHGVCLGYAVVGYRSLIKGLDKISPNYDTILNDLENHWEVLAEPIQQIMRQYGVANPYEQLKELTRGQKITKDSLREFISKLALPEDVKKKLLTLEPKDYIGNADKMARLI